MIFAIIYVTRYLDYWEILPNEILHHHGPLSDLERFPTMNLKFDKEIPDVLEYLFLGSGRLVLHVTERARRRSCWTTCCSSTRKEEALKKLMSRMEVRVTTDQEAPSIRGSRPDRATAVGAGSATVRRRLEAHVDRGRSPGRAGVGPVRRRAVGPAPRRGSGRAELVEDRRR